MCVYLFVCFIRRCIFILAHTSRYLFIWSNDPIILDVILTKIKRMILKIELLFVTKFRSNWKRRCAPLVWYKYNKWHTIYLMLEKRFFPKQCDTSFLFGHDRFKRTVFRKVFRTKIPNQRSMVITIHSFDWQTEILNKDQRFTHAGSPFQL